MLDQIKVELVSHWGGDRNAAEAAWASSTDKAKLADKSDSDVARVVTGLVHLGHDTPKERLWMEFFMTIPVHTERQLDKVRMSVQFQQFEITYQEASFGRHGITQNELSGRYRTIPDRFYEMPSDVAAILERGIPEHGEQYAKKWNQRVEQQHTQYQLLLTQLKAAEKSGQITNAEYKRAREILRGELGTAYLTDMRIVLNMNAFEHIVNQRLAPDAQLECRQVAKLMVEEVRRANICPTLLNTMIEKHGWNKWLAEF